MKQAIQHYLVVGTPITQSLSPQIHNAVYQHLVLPRELSAFDPKDKAGFCTLIQDLRLGDYSGICVTVPYKLEALQACDHLTSTAQRTGAVNYIKREPDGSLTGDNTDADGFATAAQHELGLNFAGIEAIVCGTGGASRAVVDALRQGGAKSITLVSRVPASKSQPVVIDYEQLQQSGLQYDLLVNTTPLGMKDDCMPVSARWLMRNVKAVYDVVYRKTGSTPLVATARAAQISAADGRGMLVNQAIRGMDFWNVQGQSGADDAAIRTIIDASF